VHFPHTVIDDAYEGQGLASKLVKAALDDVRESGLMIHVTCTYIKGWLGKHPEYVDLVAGPVDGPVSM
jgi:predicted GNAT family acetyltransferase